MFLGVLIFGCTPKAVVQTEHHGLQYFNRCIAQESDIYTINLAKGVTLKELLADIGLANGYSTEETLVEMFKREGIQIDVKEDYSVQVELVSLDGVGTYQDLMLNLDTMGMRPATLEELLVFAKKYPHLQQFYTIWALGTVWKDEDGVENVFYLSFYEKRELSRESISELPHISGQYRILAVRK